MPAVNPCPKCQSGLKVPEKLYGKSIRCPKCNTTFVAQGEPTPQPASSNPLDFGNSSPPTASSPRKKTGKSLEESKATPKWILPVLIASLLVVGGVSAFLILGDKASEQPPTGSAPGVVRHQTDDSVNKDNSVVKPSTRTEKKEGLSSEILEKVNRSMVQLRLKDSKGKSATNAGVIIEKNLILGFSQLALTGSYKSGAGTRFQKPAITFHDESLTQQEIAWTGGSRSGLVFVFFKEPLAQAKPLEKVEFDPTVGEEVYLLNYAKGAEKPKSLTVKKVTISRDIDLGPTSWTDKTRIFFLELDIEPPEDVVYGMPAVDKRGRLVGFLSAPVEGSKKATLLSAVRMSQLLENWNPILNQFLINPVPVTDQYSSKKMTAEEEALYRKIANALAVVRVKNFPMGNERKEIEYARGTAFFIDPDHIVAGLTAPYMNEGNTLDPRRSVFWLYTYLRGKVQRQYVPILEEKKLGFSVFQAKSERAGPGLNLAQQDVKEGDEVLFLTFVDKIGLRFRKAEVIKVPVNAESPGKVQIRFKESLEKAYTDGPVFNQAGEVVGLLPVSENNEEAATMILGSAMRASLKEKGLLKGEKE